MDLINLNSIQNSSVMFFNGMKRQVPIIGTSCTSRIAWIETEDRSPPEHRTQNPRWRVDTLLLSLGRPHFLSHRTTKQAFEMTHWTVVVVTTFTALYPLTHVLAWTHISPILPGGRFAGGSSSSSPAFLLRNSGRTNRDGEEFSTLPESTFLFHLYDNILDEPWSGVSTFDRLDELDIISSSSSTTLHDSWDGIDVCHGDECEVWSYFEYFWKLDFIFQPLKCMICF